MEMGKFGAQVEKKNIEVLKSIYHEFLKSTTKEQLIDSFIKLSEYFREHSREVRGMMTEREFAALVGFRLEEFVHHIANLIKKKYNKDVDIEFIQGKKCKMIIFENDTDWIGQGCDLAIGKWVEHKKFKHKFFVPKILVESKRYVALAPQFRDVSMLAIKWKEKYPDVKFIVFAEHNDMEKKDYLLMRDFWGSSIYDLFFIKEGSRSLERKGINNYKREEIGRFIDLMDKLIKEL